MAFTGGETLMTAPTALRAGLIAASLCAFCTVPVQAAKIYQYTNAAGETVFTDEPTEGATVHDVKPAPVIPMERVEVPEPAAEKPAESSAPAPEPAREQPPEIRLSPEDGPVAAEDDPGTTQASDPYTHFAIESPADGEMASRPRGTITVELVLQPGLRSGDRIALLVDGEARVRDSTGRRHLLNGLAPGAHRLVAQIRSDDGSVVRESTPVRFTLIVP